MMRLLSYGSNGVFKLDSFDIKTPPPYAILSHTWSDGQEVDYHDLVAGRAGTKPGWKKLMFCMEQALKDGLGYCWIDTCCIDKSSSAELGTAINSMFRWYQQATVCYVYLADVVVAGMDRASWLQAFRRSRWFTRGWTLQELLAPRELHFFSSDGVKLGDRSTLESEVYSITHIPREAFQGQKRLCEFSVVDRLRWAEGRTTTKAEDKVYSLLGIFEVFLPLIYGEGEAYAHVRLTEEIQKRHVESKKAVPRLAGALKGLGTHVCMFHAD